MTGATGAIGIALIQKCIDRDIEVYVLCHKGSKRICRIPKNEKVHLIECNLDDMVNLDVSKIPECDVFYHMGWVATIGDGRNDMRLQLDNVKYTLDAVALAERFGCKKFVGAGSQAEYGRFEGKLNSSVATFPENGYGIAKLCAGQMSKIECSKRGLQHVWARILSVYGPYDGEKTMIVSTIRKLLEGERPSFTEGKQQWDYLYSTDAARALLAIGDKGKDGKIYCIGSGKAAMLSDYIYKIRDCINPDAELGLGDIEYGEKQVMYLCADISELTYDTDFVPEVAFEDGIKMTVEWYRKDL